MPERSTYEHGIPSWVDLASDDVPASRRFYGELFGWDFVEEPTDQEGVAYTLAMRSGKTVAAIAPNQPGRPAAWQTYVTVDDVDATAARVGPAGGTVLMEPFDVMEAGRMAVVADPTGGVVNLWTPKTLIGAELVNEHGSLSWNELVTPDVATAVAFFAEVIGWTTQVMPGPGADYTVFMAGERGIAGTVPPQQEGIPPHWDVYFAVDDSDKAVATTSELGGSVLVEPFDAPGIGRIAFVRDPQGTAFGVIQLEGVVT